MSAARDLMREQMRETFLAEARDLVADLDEGLRRLRAGDRDPELIARLFRAAHSIKGSGGMFGLVPLVGFTHVVENLLERVRAGTLGCSEALVADLQDASEHIADLIELLVAREGTMQAADIARDGALRAALERHAATEAAPAASTNDATQGAEGDGGDGDGRDGHCWHVSVRLGADVFRYGINPLSFLRDLADIGEIVRLVTLAEGMPEASAFDPETCHLGFEIDLRTEASKARIAEVFDFVADCSQIRILPPSSRIDDYVALIRELPEPEGRLGELLVRAGMLTRAELKAGLAAQVDQAASGRATPLGAVLMDQAAVPEAVVQAALDRQAQVRASAAAHSDSAFVRVRADRLDELINLVGELVIAGAGASLLADCSGQVALRESQANVSRLMEDIRERALRLRMVPIGETFARFHRVVRDVERDLGKGIDLVIEGGDTELDKSVVERLADPLMHLVRNAADHGIEPPDVRAARGKPARGRVTLSAAHASGSVVIEIRDDGAGLDRARILAKAVERGVVPAGATLTDHETFQLIFEPGFSTAAQVTNLSGRGVGMDVVRRNITDLRGSIEIESPPGQGTTMRVRLPLTLAIIEGFLVGVGDAAFVLPLDRVVECVELPEGLRADQGVLDLRGHALPLLRLREQLHVDSPQRTRRQNVVVVDHEGQRAGFVVDALLGEFQTVIKPLGALFSRLRGISGSTILGSGDVALILDVPQLLEAAVRADVQSQRSGVVA